MIPWTEIQYSPKLLLGSFGGLVRIMPKSTSWTHELRQSNHLGKCLNRDLIKNQALGLGDPSRMCALVRASFCLRISILNLTEISRSTSNTAAKVVASILTQHYSISICMIWGGLFVCSDFCRSSPDSSLLGLAHRKKRESQKASSVTRSILEHNIYNISMILYSLPLSVMRCQRVVG